MNEDNIKYWKIISIISLNWIILLCMIFFISYLITNSGTIAKYITIGSHISIWIYSSFNFNKILNYLKKKLQ